MFDKKEDLIVFLEMILPDKINDVEVKEKVMHEQFAPNPLSPVAVVFGCKECSVTIKIDDFENKDCAMKLMDILGNRKSR